MSPYIRSVLRYPGGKSRALSTIIPRLPNGIEEYREPFVGGGSVFIRVKQLLGDDIAYTINDVNPDVILFWREVQRDGSEFIAYVYEMKNSFETGKELYQFCKDTHHDLNNFERAVRFFIMNRITFSGLIDSGGYSRESYEKRFTNSIIDKIGPLSDLLEGVKITQGDYAKHLNDSGTGVFIFLDPPYFAARNSKLYGFKGDLHQEFDHSKFAECVRKCEYKWLMTCEDSKEMHELFYFAKRSIHWTLRYGMTNANNNSTTRIGSELLLSNYPMKKNPKYVFPTSNKRK